MQALSYRHSSLQLTWYICNAVDNAIKRIATFFSLPKKKSLHCEVHWQNITVPRKGRKEEGLIYIVFRGDLKLQEECIGLYTQPYWLPLLNTWSNTLVSFTKDAKELKFSTEYSLHRGLLFIEVLFTFFFSGTTSQILWVSDVWLLCHTKSCWLICISYC